MGGLVGWFAGRRMYDDHQNDKLVLIQETTTGNYNVKIKLKLAYFAFSRMMHSSRMSL